MAAEAVLVKKHPEGAWFQVTVADGTGLEKGTVLKFSADPNTAAASSADGDLFAGILAEEKVASDGQTEVAVYRKGVFQMTVGGAVTTVLGEPVKITGANLIGAADDDTIAHSSEAFGISLETGANDEVILVLVGNY